METLEGARIYRPIKPSVSLRTFGCGRWRIRGENIVVVRASKGHKTPEDLKAVLIQHNVDALITRTSLDVNRAVLEGAGLQLVMGACKNPTVDRTMARELGIEGLGTHENTNQVADHVMSIIYGFATGTTGGAVTTRQSRWRKREIGDHNFDIRDKKIGNFRSWQDRQTSRRIAK